MLIDAKTKKNVSYNKKTTYMCYMQLCGCILLSVDYFLQRVAKYPL